MIKDSKVDVMAKKKTKKDKNKMMVTLANAGNTLIFCHCRKEGDAFSCTLVTSIS